MSLLSRLRKQPTQLPVQWDAYDGLWGGWNYPKPIYPDHSIGFPPDDGDLIRLIYMAEHGWYYCQKAFVPITEIHPLTGYKPVISHEFRETFKQRLRDDRMPLTVYEKNGKLILGTSWEEYWMYREVQEISAACIILGHFTERPEIIVCDKPFWITKKESNLYASKSMGLGF